MTPLESNTTNAPRVPLVDLAAVYRELEDQLVLTFRRVLHGGSYILGPDVETFEARVAQWLGVSHCVAVSSGTDALLGGLLALDLRPGDEVITSPLTFVSTAEAILRVGAVPVFADVCPRCLCLDPASVAERVTPRTRGIVPVHLYGELGHIEQLLLLAKAQGLFVLEDACQAFGSATADSRKAGTLGDIGCFSFFPTKILGALGDAGLVCTHDSDLAERLRSLRSHGRSGKHRFSRMGGNFRMDALQAALLSVLLCKLDEWIATRNAIASRYTSALASVPGLRTPSSCMRGMHAWSVYTIRVDRQREALVQHLNAAGVETGIYYPITLADQPLFQTSLPCSMNIENARQAAREVLSLPIYPGMTPANQAFVVQSVSDHRITTNELRYGHCNP